jgi:hypothetical protein
LPDLRVPAASLISPPFIGAALNPNPYLSNKRKNSMQVKIKDFTVDMDVKTKGIEFDVSDNNDKHLGDLIVNKTGIVWCQGKTTPAKGKRVKWKDFINLLNNAD